MFLLEKKKRKIQLCRIIKEKIILISLTYVKKCIFCGGYKM